MDDKEKRKELKLHGRDVNGGGGKYYLFKISMQLHPRRGLSMLLLKKNKNVSICAFV